MGALQPIKGKAGRLEPQRAIQWFMGVLADAMADVADLASMVAGEVLHLALLLVIGASFTETLARLWKWELAA